MQTIQPLAVLLLLLAIPIPAQTQQSAPPSAMTTDAQSTVLIQRALSAMGGASTVTDVALSGRVHHIAGSTDETGQITLKALGPNLSRAELILPSVSLSEVRGSRPNGGAAGISAGADGIQHAISFANTFTPAAWFSPAFLLQKAEEPSVTVSYLGKETRNGQTVLHLHAFAPHKFPPAATKVPQFVQASANRLSAFDIYLDSATYVPVAVTFATHPDKHAGINIPVEIGFSDYRAVGAVQMPFHIQRNVNGTLEMDITVESVSANSGLQAADFNVQ